ncbi:MAG: hypothetical protein KF764_26100 [Labilithrix sp.]|nr:hypothetical protein [Labilithrix sp.]
MIRRFTRLSILLLTTLAGTGCIGTDDSAHNDNAHDDNASRPDDTLDAGSPVKVEDAARASLPFTPSNLPPDVSLAPSGDWVFNSKTCSGVSGRPVVEVDGTTGTVSCGLNKQEGGYIFKTIKQTDATYGELTTALFITNNLVIEPNTTVYFTGDRPVIIVALGTAKIEGTIRASVHRTHMKVGNAGGFDGTSDRSKGNGPGGGGPGLPGSGAGGGGHCGVGGADVSAAGGKSYGSAANVPLLGGSAGGSGAGLPSGAGGGAVQIVSATSIEVSGLGAISVAGGGGGPGRSGGGAGGSILLEAPIVSVMGTLAANGGGGGESGQWNDGSPGSADALLAKGGVASGGPAHAAGGDGAAGPSIDGFPGASVSDKHGGGGGGAGRIRINTTSGSATIGSAAVISPFLTTRCATQGKIAAR